MIHINGLADREDISKVLSKYKEQDVLSVLPCPVGENGKINPHVTKFLLRDGTNVSIFHIKPIYYETLDGQWRPMSEVALGFGNMWIDFRGDWHTKMHPRYMNWLQKRMTIIRGKINISTPTMMITVEGKPLTTT